MNSRLGNRLSVRWSQTSNFVRRKLTGYGIVAYWADTKLGRINWGDKLNPYIISALSEKHVYHSDRVVLGRDESVHMVIGSMLAHARSNCEVWGCGFIDAREKVTVRPRAIHALRGPLSRMQLDTQGLKSPRITGDPAILMPLFYYPKIVQDDKIGLVLHFRERGVVNLPKLMQDHRIRMIDITGGIEEVIDAIASCRRVFSTSLHGLIAANAYGVPSTWISASDILLGDGFKFRDYLSSVGSAQQDPVLVSAETTVDELLSVAEWHGFGLDVEGLISACPFVSEERKSLLLKGAAKVFVHPG